MDPKEQLRQVEEEMARVTDCLRAPGRRRTSFTFSDCSSTVQPFPCSSLSCWRSVFAHRFAAAMRAPLSHAGGRACFKAATG